MLTWQLSCAFMMYSMCWACEISVNVHVWIWSKQACVTERSHKTWRKATMYEWSIATEKGFFYAWQVVSKYNAEWSPWAEVSKSGLFHFSLHLVPSLGLCCVLVCCHGPLWCCRNVLSNTCAMNLSTAVQPNTRFSSNFLHTKKKSKLNTGRYAWTKKFPCTKRKTK